MYAKTSKQLEELVAETKYKLRTGQYQSLSNITVYDYANKWFDTFKSNKSINTIAMYKNIIEKHIDPAIGHIPLKDLTYTDCQYMINERFHQYETCHKIALTMKQIEKRALKDRIIIESFWDEIEMPVKPESKKRALTDLEKESLVQAEFKPMEKAFVYLLYGCGLRREEALALCIDDINLKDKCVNISQVIVFEVNKPVLKASPKTKNGKRTIPIPSGVFDAIQFYLLQRKRIVNVNDTNLLFTMSNGGMIPNLAMIRCGHGLYVK